MSGSRRFQTLDTNISLVRALQALYTEVLDLSTLLQGSAAFKSHSAAMNSTLESTSDLPHSILLFPVKNGRSKEVPGELVGVLAAVLSWDQLIASALPENDLELICVLENSCGQAYTYQMNGSKVGYCTLGGSVAM